MSTTRFDDFDAWAGAISGAHLRLACDKVETPAWSLALLPLGDTCIQVASEGGGNLCYGGNTHCGPHLFIPLTHSSEHVANGSPLDDDSLLAIPRGADFSVRIRRRAHRWCSIALPADTPLAGVLPDGSDRITCRPGAVRALGRLVEDVATALVDRPVGTAAHAAAGRRVLDAAVTCVTDRPAHAPTTGRPRLDRAVIVRRVMEAIEATPLPPSVADLAHVTGVNSRTLLRTFRETFGVPPKQYLMLRELHTIRRVLSRGAPDDATVADLLMRHGVWEFGRFAGRYRCHFGELPSETLRRARSG